MNIWTKLAAFATMETERLVLRPLVYSDRHRFYEMTSNPDNARFILPTLATKPQSTDLLVKAFMQQPLGVWAISLKPDQSLVGIIRLDHLDVGNGRAELGYLCHQAYWGQGVMTEAVKTVTFLAFNQLNWRQLTIVCHEDNLASQRVAQKAGFTFIGRHKGSDRYSHKIGTYLTYQLKAGDYQYE